jgi:hypothetical protein
MDQTELRRAAIRTLRAVIIRRRPPGERRDHLLAWLEVIVEGPPANVPVFVVD